MSENLFGLTVAADKGLDDLQCQRLLSENRRYQEVMLQYRCALKALESRLEILNEEFSLQHDRNPIESMKSRLKSPSSIMNKMQKRGLSLDFPTMQANIMDVAGVRVICAFQDDIYKLAKCFLDQDDVILIQKKDYIANPKPSGYRSLHLIVKTPIFLKEGKKMMEYTLYAYTFVIVKQYSFPRGFRHMRTNGKENIFLRKQGMQGRVTQCCGIYLIGWKHWLFRFRRTRSFLL